MANKKSTVGPIALTATLTTNLFNPAAATGGVNAGSSPQAWQLKHFRFINTTVAAIQVTVFLGATGANAAGTELLKLYNVPANSVVDLYDDLRIDSTQFLVGGASAVGCNMLIEGEVFVAG